MLFDLNTKSRKGRLNRIARSPEGKRFLARLLAALLITAGLGAVLMVGYQALAHSEFFWLTAIELTGNRHVRKDAVIELAGVHVRSNLLALDLAEMRRRLETDQWIERARLTRKWPSVLKIEIVERSPEALVSRPDGFHYLDRQGTVFAQAARPGDLDYPVITIQEGDTAAGDSENEPGLDTASVIGEVLAFLKQAGKGNTALPRQNVSQIQYGPDNGYVLYLVDRPFPIYLGESIGPREYARLARTLYWLYKKDEFNQVAYIKLRYLDNKVLVGKID